MSSATTVYITSLYSNILHRDADQAEINYWENQFNLGLLESKDIVTSFLNSQEFTKNIAPIQNLYYSILQRAPDQNGLNYWIDQHLQGASIKDIATNFIDSVEYDSIIDSTISNEEFIENLYLYGLERSSDVTGKNYWIEQLQKGVSRSDITTSFISSNELQNKNDLVTKIMAASIALHNKAATSDQLNTSMTLEEMIINLYNSTNYTGVNVPGASGIVSDGYIAGATVFADANGDGIWNKGEVKTTTDANGDFTLVGGSGSIVATGGTDISTNIPFEGIFTAPEGSTTVSPITTLVDQVMKTTVDSSSPISKEEAMSKVASALGLSTNTNLLTFDPIKAANDNSLSSEEQNEAAAIQLKAVQVVNMMSQAASTLEGAGVANEREGASIAASSLAQMILSAPTEESDDTQNSSLAINFSSKQTIQSFLETSAQKAGASTEQINQISSVVPNISEAISNINTLMSNALENSEQKSGFSTIFEQLANVQKAAQSIKEHISTAVSSGNTSDVTKASKKDALEDTIKEIEQTGEIPDQTPTNTNSNNDSSENTTTIQAPFVVKTLAGEKVNEVLLHIISTPNEGENVTLSFENLDPSATIFDSYGNNVTSGIENYVKNELYKGNHKFKVIMSQNIAKTFDIKAVEIAKDGSLSDEYIVNTELMYQKNTTNSDIAFTNINQSMWGNFDYLNGVIDPNFLEGMEKYGAYLDIENLNLQFHEYYPILGNDFKQWDAKNGEWIDNETEYWRSGKFNVVDFDVSSTDLTTLLADYAHKTLDEAKAVYDATAFVIDKVAQDAYDEAVQTLDYAYEVYQDAIGTVDSAVQKAWNEAKAMYNQAKQDYQVAYDAFYNGAQGIFNTAKDVWDSYDNWYQGLNGFLKGLNWLPYQAAKGVYTLAVGAFDLAVDIWNDAVYAFDIVATGAYQAAKATYEAAVDGLNDAAKATYEGAKTTFEGAKELYEAAKVEVEKVAQGIYDGVKNGVDDMLNLANTIDLSTEVSVEADVFARAGLQLDFVLDAGSVNTDIQYKLVSTNEYNQSIDMLAITPTLHNLDDDTLTPFTTVSPNASIYAALLYDVGADLDFYVDGSLTLANYTVFDLGGLGFSPTISTIGTNYTFDFDENGVPYIQEHDEVSTYQELLTNYGIDLGLPEDPSTLVLLDLDSKDAEAVALPGLDTLTKGVIEEIEVAIPTVETEGKLVSNEELISNIKNSLSYQMKNVLGLASDPNEQTLSQNINEYYYDEAIDEVSDVFEVINLQQLTSSFENASITLGDKVVNILENSTAFLDQYGSINEFLTDAEIDEIILGVASGFAKSMATEFLDYIDGSYETGTFLAVDLTNTSSEALFHANTWDFNTDKIIEGLITGDNGLLSYDYEKDLTEDTASFGLYASSGESDPFVSIKVDVDAVAAIIISQILKKVATVVSAGAATALEAIPDELLNPFEQELGLETLLNIAEVPKETADEIQKYINLEYKYTKVDADVITSADFSQDFTLTVDDMSYVMTMEDGTKLSFLASESEQFIIENASQYDINNNGKIEYDLKLVPTAMFSNDTELGLNLGLEMDFLASEFEAKVKLPLAELFGGENSQDDNSGNNNSQDDDSNNIWPTIEIPIKYSFGPLLEIDWEMNGLDIDTYESRFEMDIGEETLEDNSVNIQLNSTQDTDTLMIA